MGLVHGRLRQRYESVEREKCVICCEFVTGGLSEREATDFAQAQSGGGPPQSKTLARVRERWTFQQVLGCGIFDIAVTFVQ